MNYSKFRADRTDEIQYRFDCPEYELLKEKYNLMQIAGKGDNFSRAKRLLNHLTPRMKHDSMYDNHVECNALALLEYCYEKPEHGINCLNKSKIFSECCLAVGIPARRVIIMPYSPYDGDNHVVTEIYDDKREKWVMMDPTSGGMFVDEKGIPLSLLEMRERFAHNSFITFMSGTCRTKDLQKLEKKNLEDNWYICKNSFYYIIQKHQEFGERKGDNLFFIPEGYFVRENEITNLRYRIEAFGQAYPDMKEYFEKRLRESEKADEPKGTDIEAMTRPWTKSQPEK